MTACPAVSLCVLVYPDPQHPSRYPLERHAMARHPAVPGLSDEWATHQLDLLELVPVVQEPACRWAHGDQADLDQRGLCPVCADDEVDP